MLINIFLGDWSTAETFILIFVFLIAVTIALVMHEWAHAFAAYKCGDPTAKLLGRMSINPAKHVEPTGLLMFLLAGIGWAKPVPVNPFNFRNYRKGNFWVSTAGVITNLIIGFVASFFFAMIYHLAPNPNLALWGLGMFFMFLMAINLSLMIFNLIPIYPLDGFNVLRSFTKPNNRYMLFMQQYGHIVLIIVLIISMATRAIWYFVELLQTAFLGLWGLIF